MAEVTLTAAMRANLYSLQQTANLMGTVQNRLSTGKKVNSALDNPNNYFTAQSLSNRASDIGSLLDGMGQAIQAIKAASQGIESAQKLIDQMKAVANSAIQSANSSSNGDRTEIEATGTVDAQKLMTEDDPSMLLTNLKNNTTGASLGIAVGDTLTVAINTADTLTFTVTETSSVKDLTDFIEASGTDVAVAVSSGVTTITAGAGSLTIAGSVATALDIDVSGLTSSTSDTASSITVATGPIMLADAAASASVMDDTIALTSLVDENGDSLGIAIGDTLSIKLGDSGQTVTFTVGADNSDNTTANANGGGMTLKDLQTWVEAQGDGTDDFQLTVSNGKVRLDNDATAALSLEVSGNLAESLGINGTAAASTGYLEGDSNVYYALQNSPDVVKSDTLLRDITAVNGTFISNGQGQVGDYLTVALDTGTTRIDFSEGMTVGDLMTQLNSLDENFSVSLDSAGRFVVDNQTTSSVTFTGEARAFFTNPGDGTYAFSTNAAGAEQTSSRIMYGGYQAASNGSTSSGTIDATKSEQFDTLRTQLDELVSDASYQGTNLISSANNSPLTVTFNEQATDASKLVISAVDLTTTGLGIKAASGDATGSWQDTAAVESTLETLTSAATTLRNQAATFGYNLSTVQNRQDFAQNMIATLKEGADKLTLADMNEEGANMLALQTRSQLGTQSLSLASQANQSVMRLFG